MATLFHIPTTDRFAGQRTGLRASGAFAGMTSAKRWAVGTHMVNDGKIAPAGRRTR